MQAILGIGILLIYLFRVPIIPFFGTISALGITWLAIATLRTPGAGMGARTAHDSKKPELSLQSLDELLQVNNDGRARWHDDEFRYLELSVQETKDHVLVLFHDLGEEGLGRAFPRKGKNENEMEKLEGVLQTNISKLTVSEVMLAQLQSLHLFGYEHIHVPTLEEYLARCREAEFRKPIALEVRHVHSEIARATLIRLVNEHRQQAQQAGMTLVEGAYDALGLMSPVGEPSRWASVYGEFTSPTWAHWATRMRIAQVPARCKCCHGINLGWLAPDVLGHS